MPSKQALLEELRAQVHDELATLARSQQSSQAGATHEEARPESDKDTRAIESSYLARGLAERVELLRKAVAVLQGWKMRDYGPDDAVGVGALVALRSPRGVQRYLLVPMGGGRRLGPSGDPVSTVTPSAPLGRALVGRYVDDDVEFDSPEGPRCYDLIELA